MTEIRDTRDFGNFFEEAQKPLTKTPSHRWKCLLDRDPKAKLYMPLPPRVSYSRTSSLRDIIVRSKVPRPVRVARRQVNSGFRKCNRRMDCSVCSHSVNTITHIAGYHCKI